ncbi:MAG: radical SAM protein [Candidatus Omnitrophica bacterium]|nr:radical SAM protein [Candidatus Omnitrophota bacterium]
MPLTEPMLDHISLGHIWIFLTERCNLSCDYCFFSRRGRGQTLPWAKLKALFLSLPPGRPHDIVLSGGEPLLEWALVQRAVVFIRQQLPGSGITLQTNALLLNAEKVKFLKATQVSVEPGIDGLCAANVRHRAGTGQGRYQTLLKNIQLLHAEKIRMNPTMTVHPSEVSGMEENFTWLVAQGLMGIEVHPAFMAPWSKAQARIFETGYKKILALDLRSKKQLICRDYSAPMRPAMDLVVQPDGNIVPNWTYLTFPKARRASFYTMRLTAQGIEPYPQALAAYLKQARVFFCSPRSYRDLSNWNARRILKTSPDRKEQRRFSVYAQICRRAQELDRGLAR